MLVITVNNKDILRVCKFYNTSQKKTLYILATYPYRLPLLDIECKMPILLILYSRMSCLSGATVSYPSLIIHYNAHGTYGK